MRVNVLSDNGVGVPDPSCDTFRFCAVFNQLCDMRVAERVSIKPCRPQHPHKASPRDQLPVFTRTNQRDFFIVGRGQGLRFSFDMGVGFAVNVDVTAAVRFFVFGLLNLPSAKFTTFKTESSNRYVIIDDFLFRELKRW